MQVWSQQYGENESPPSKNLIPAAIYVRMSTEHQKYSTENQSDAIHRYAAERGLVIVKTYADEGKSGLRLDGRNALKMLFKDVESGNANFNAILVYDVSRWGRFQDADESAYYEYTCRRAGIGVHYCAEQFENDGSPFSTIVKGVKRAMSGEYSRELSTKVFAGQCRLIELGYRQGGPAGFGLRRTLVDHTGAAKGELRAGEHKSIQTDRVLLVPGPQNEIEIVQDIYRSFVIDKETEQQIANRLNAQEVLTDNGRSWTRGTVHQVLINEKYIGNNVWNRISYKLKNKRVKNDPTVWVRLENAFEGIVDRQMFETARSIIAGRSFRLSNEQMLASLRSLFESKGMLSGLVIDEAEGLASSSAYRCRFQSLYRAYSLVGYSPRRDYRYIAINRALRRLYPDILATVIQGMENAGARVVRNSENDLINISDEFSVSVIIARCLKTVTGALRWKLRFDMSLSPDITLAIRMDPDNRLPLDYYLFPRIDFVAEKFCLKEYNDLQFDAYRIETLDSLFELAMRFNIMEAA